MTGRRFRAALVSVCLGVAAGSAGGQTSDFGGLPEGPGQLETFGNCTACHSAMIIMQQNFDRRTWDEVLTWMVESQGMWVMPPETRQIVLDYLVTHFGPE
jgi:hypothetical protein